MTTRAEYWVKQRREAQRAYREHQLLAETYWDGTRGARWLVGTPGSSIFLTEIIAGACGSLVVHGDVDLSRFAYATDDAWPRLCWMAARPPSEYTHEKYQIGMGRTDPTLCFDRDVAASDMQMMVDDLICDGDSPRQLVQAILTVRERHLHECATTADVLSRIEAEFPDACSDLYEWSVGDVPPVKMFYAHAAMERCMLLLWGKYGPDGPPGAAP